ncbi:hypothetical protein Dimus_036376, partial [Dionaea muscipula]
MAVGLNTGVPWITCKQDDALDPIDFVHNQYYKPKMFTELWSGWYTPFGGAVAYRPVEDVAFAVTIVMQNGCSFVNYYMYHGGTNFGTTAGRFVTTSYDYDAPIDEYGCDRDHDEPQIDHLLHFIFGFISGHEGSDSISSCSPAILAPPPWLSQRFEDTGGREVWLAAYPLAHKKASARTRLRCIAKRMSKAAVADGDFREKIGCRRSGRLSSPACPVPEELGSGSFQVLTPIDEVLGSDVLQNEEVDDSVDLVLDLPIVPGDSAILGKDSEVTSAVMWAPSSLRRDSEGPRTALHSDVPCDVQPPVMLVTEGMLNVEGDQGGLGNLVDGVSALLPDALVSGPCLHSVAADVFVDNSTVVCSSVVGDFVEVEEELAASTVGGQQALVGGDAVRLPSTDGRQQQPPLPPTSCLRVGKDLRCSGDFEERQQQVSPIN